MPEYHGRIKETPESAPRLDRYLSENALPLSRSQLKVRNVRAFVNGKPAKFSLLISAGDMLDVFWDDEIPHDITPEKIALDVLYEDTQVIVVNKTQGMVVHPAPGNWNGTLLNALLGHREAPAKPAIAHRLDKDTSGVIIAAWNTEALAFLQEQFKSRSVRKTYIALCKGIPQNFKGKISSLLCRDPRHRKRFTISAVRGKHAVTRYHVKAVYEAAGAVYSLFLLRPKTGRTHQLRVQLKQLGCPILGDQIYGSVDKQFPRATLMLHARHLDITLPGSTEHSRWSAPIPERFSLIHTLSPHVDSY